jgi:hypothetical protein
MVHRTLVPDSDADSLAREPLTFIRVNQQQRKYSATLEPELLLTWILAALREVGRAKRPARGCGRCARCSRPPALVISL